MARMAKTMRRQMTTAAGKDEKEVVEWAQEALKLAVSGDEIKRGKKKELTNG